MSSTYTNIDARDIQKLADDLRLTIQGVAVRGLSDAMGLSMLRTRLEVIARNIQSLDEKAAHAFRDGQLQATIKSAENSNVIGVMDIMTVEIIDAIAKGRVTIKKLPPAVPTAMKEELTIDDLDLDI